MAFAVYTSNMLERLADRLAERVVRSPLAPLEKETVVVMSVGMGRWISQRMAERLGVWANFEYLFPTVLIERIFGIFSGGGARFRRSTAKSCHGVSSPSSPIVSRVMGTGRSPPISATAKTN